MQRSLLAPQTAARSTQSLSPQSMLPVAVVVDAVVAGGLDRLGQLRSSGWGRRPQQVEVPPVAAGLEQVRPGCVESQNWPGGPPTGWQSGSSQSISPSQSLSMPSPQLVSLVPWVETQVQAPPVLQVPKSGLPLTTVPVAQLWPQAVGVGAAGLAVAVVVDRDRGRALGGQLVGLAARALAGRGTGGAAGPAVDDRRPWRRSRGRRSRRARLRRRRRPLVQISTCTNRTWIRPVARFWSEAFTSALPAQPATTCESQVTSVTSNGVVWVAGGEAAALQEVAAVGPDHDGPLLAAVDVDDQALTPLATTHRRGGRDGEGRHRRGAAAATAAAAGHRGAIAAIDERQILQFMWYSSKGSGQYPNSRGMYQGNGHSDGR